MFNPSQRFSWRNFISVIVVIILLLFFWPYYGSPSYPFFEAHPVIFMIIYYGGIALIFIIGIIWRPNMRRRRKIKEEKSE